eukprot:gnl/TRDRNA2_/TRDRNA2_165388_c2_seq20.p1 gnl/TRDRNA2_/TRDRNA2_165388_c2~~gnl/TRDRNA2_/TRDRNA2_165388_c2_seq20.p1  ORF type:complete len:858 (+),score=234.72 gnl/TRDRNA2_/TRDRNA2_165388_c2_seq20:1-2574(+)
MTAGASGFGVYGRNAGGGEEKNPSIPNQDGGDNGEKKEKSPSPPPRGGPVGRGGGPAGRGRGTAMPAWMKQGVGNTIGQAIADAPQIVDEKAVKKEEKRKEALESMFEERDVKEDIPDWVKNREDKGKGKGKWRRRRGGGWHDDKEGGEGGGEEGGEGGEGEEKGDRDRSRSRGRKGKGNRRWGSWKDDWSKKDGEEGGEEGYDKWKDKGWKKSWSDQEWKEWKESKDWKNEGGGGGGEENAEGSGWTEEDAAQAEAERAAAQAVAEAHAAVAAAGPLVPGQPLTVAQAMAKAKAKMAETAQANLKRPFSAVAGDQSQGWKGNAKGADSSSMPKMMGGKPGAAVPPLGAPGKGLLPGKPTGPPGKGVVLPPGKGGKGPFGKQNQEEEWGTPDSFMGVAPPEPTPTESAPSHPWASLLGQGTQPAVPTTGLAKSALQSVPAAGLAKSSLSSVPAAGLAKSSLPVPGKATFPGLAMPPPQKGAGKGAMAPAQAKFGAGQPPQWGAPQADTSQGDSWGHAEDPSNLEDYQQRILMERLAEKKRKLEEAQQQAAALQAQRDQEAAQAQEQQQHMQQLQQLQAQHQQRLEQQKIQQDLEAKKLQQQQEQLKLQQQQQQMMQQQSSQQQNMQNTQYLQTLMQTNPALAQQYMMQQQQQQAPRPGNTAGAAAGPPKAPSLFAAADQEAPAKQPSLFPAAGAAAERSAPRRSGSAHPSLMGRTSTADDDSSKGVRGIGRGSDCGSSALGLFGSPGTVKGRSCSESPPPSPATTVPSPKKLPGGLASMKDMFEQKLAEGRKKDEPLKKTSWKPPVHNELSLPSGEGSGKFPSHEQQYKKKTSMTKEPPKRRSLEELLKSDQQAMDV